MTILRNFYRNRHGVAAIEFAIVLPVLIVLLGGFFECTWLFWVHSSMENAVTAAGRFAMVNGATDARIWEEFKANSFSISTDGMTFTNTPSQDQSIQYETLRVTRSHIPLLNWLPAFSHITLQSEITIPPAAGVLDCSQLPTRMNTARGYLMRVENDRKQAIRLFWLDQDGNKTLLTRIDAGAAQMLPPPLIQNGQPWVVTDDSGSCLNIIVPWRPTSNVIISEE